MDRNSGCKEVLILGPRQQDYAALEKVKGTMDGYNFHFLEPPQPMVFGSTLPSKEFSRKLDYTGFVDKAVEYVHHNNISSIVFSIDSMAMIGAAVCQETGLPGPTFESEFLCLHKYYSRKTEPSNLWCECAFLSHQGKTGEVKFPCFMKPATLTGSLGIFKACNHSDLEKALVLYREHLPPLVQAWQPLFIRYLDLEQYPLAVTPVAVIEEFVDDGGKSHCLEGWADSQGAFHHWSTYDGISYTYQQENLVGFFIPSLEPPESIAAIVDHTSGVVENHGLKSVFFNVDLWKRGDRIDITEINGRCTPSTIGVYSKLYSSSIYRAMIYLACGEDEKCISESPCLKPPPVLQSGRFRWYTNRQGIAKELLDFSKARTIGEEEEIYDVFGNRSKSFMLHVEEDTWVPPGTQLGTFVIFGPTRTELLERAKGVMSQLMM